MEKNPLFGNTPNTVEAFLLATFSNVTEQWDDEVDAFSTGPLTNTSSGSLEGSVLATDWKLDICVPRYFQISWDVISLASISQNADFNHRGCGKRGNCPQVPIYHTESDGKRIAVWNEDYLENDSQLLNASPMPSMNFWAFGKAAAFCHGCAGANVAGYLISDLVLSAALKDSLPLMVLHVAALKYRNTLATADSSYPATYTMQSAAVIITTPAFVYDSATLVLMVSLTAVMARHRATKIVGNTRKGSAVSAACILAEGPFARIVRTSSAKEEKDILRDASKLKARNLRLRSAPGRAGFVEVDIKRKPCMELNTNLVVNGAKSNEYRPIRVGKQERSPRMAEMPIAQH